jgi:signal transduction histidine kinase
MTGRLPLRLPLLALAAAAAVSAALLFSGCELTAVLPAAFAALVGSAAWQAYARARQRIALVQGAVDALADGFILYDRHDRVALTNRKYRELHADNLLATRLGVRFEDLFRQAIACGEIPVIDADIEAVVKERLALHRDPAGAIEQCNNGQWLRIAEHRTVDGGTVGIHSDITALKSAQAAAEAAEQLLRDAVDSISAGFVIYDADDRLVLCNQHYRELYESHGELIVPGARFEDMVRASLAAGQIPDAIGNEEAWLAMRLRQHRQGETTIEERRADGRWVLITERNTRVGGVAGMRIDITDLKDAQARAEAAQARMEDFADAATDWFWEADVDGNLTYLSEPFEAATGISVASRIGAKRLDINRELDPENPGWDEHLRTVFDKDKFRDFVMTVQTPKGMKHLSVSGKPLLGVDGDFQGYRGTTRDVTVEIDAQRTLARQKEELAATAEQLKAANAAKSMFLANMSHELRTPLNAVLGFSEIMRDARIGPLSPKYKEYACDIHDAAGHLLEIINDVLETSKMEAGQITLREDWIELIDLINECRTLLSEKAEEGNVALGIDLQERLPTVFADRLRLKQALLNILSNAVKFTAPGGSVTVSIERPDNGGLTIVIADTGIGMKSTDIALAMEPFRQLDSSFTRRYQGTGLGLPLAKAFVELHKGTLEIASEPAKGTTIRIGLPPERVSNAQPTVLVVEDNELMGFTMGMMLERLGYRVERAMTARQALNMLDSGQAADLVISDIVMPGEMSGIEFAKLMRDRQPTLPIVLTTGFTSAAADGIADGFTLLLKPYPIEQLATTLEKLLHSSPA